VGPVRGTRPLQLWRASGLSVFGLVQLLQLALVFFSLDSVSSLSNFSQFIGVLNEEGNRGIGKAVDKYIIRYAYTSVQSVITFDGLGRCFRFVYIYARILLCFLYCYVSR